MRLECRQASTTPSCLAVSLLCLAASSTCIGLGLCWWCWGRWRRLKRYWKFMGGWSAVGLKQRRAPLHRAGSGFGSNSSQVRIQGWASLGCTSGGGGGAPSNGGGGGAGRRQSSHNVECASGDRDHGEGRGKARWPASPLHDPYTSHQREK